MFKVGDRVWDKTLKRYLTITEIDDDLFTCRDTYVLEKNAHKTADDMFKELGFEMFNVDDNFIFRGKEYKITFDTGFGGCYIDKLVGDIDTFIDTQLHQAIHQKMIELGWIE